MAKPSNTVRQWLLLFILINAALEGCSWFSASSKDRSKLNCILLGNDSIACYYGSSKELHDVRRGVLADAAFIRDIVHDIKRQDSGLVISIKPAAAGNVVEDLQRFMDLMKANGLIHQSIDTLDANEEAAFHTMALQKVAVETMASPMHLALPKEEEGSARSDYDKVSLSSRLVVLTFGDSGIYVYIGNDIKAGKQYTYPEFRKFLAKKKKDPALVVIIRASASSTYRCTVKMLDEMTMGGIKKYQLVDITKSEEDFLNRFIRTP
jgi:biopolymer transport protein ExbD